jgi:hypothetical protein
MGQIEVYEILKAKRLANDNRFFSSSEVEKFIKDAGFSVGSVRRSLNILKHSGYVEVKLNSKFSDWRLLYRLKGKYVKG